MVMDAIPIYEFGSIIKTLEKRFKKLSVDQQEIYYDRLKHTKAETLKKAVIHFVDNAPHFPTPGEVIKKCRDFDNDEYKAGRGSFEMPPSCPRCRNGQVQFWYEFQCRNGKTIKRVHSRPCGFCNTEMNASPHHIQVGDQIYVAARPVPGMKHFWFPDTNNREIRMDILEPVYAQKDLEIYCEQERSGKVVRSEPPKEFLEKIRGITGKTPSLSFDPEEAL